MMSDYVEVEVVDQPEVIASTDMTNHYLKFPTKSICFQVRQTEFCRCGIRTALWNDGCSLGRGF